MKFHTEMVLGWNLCSSTPFLSPSQGHEKSKLFFFVSQMKLSWIGQQALGDEADTYFTKFIFAYLSTKFIELRSQRPLFSGLKGLLCTAEAWGRVTLEIFTKSSILG